MSLDEFDRFVRDQEVGGSNPLAPTTLPFIGLSYLFIFNCTRVLCTNVYQVKAQSSSFRPFLAERNIVLELRGH